MRSLVVSRRFLVIVAIVAMPVTGGPVVAREPESPNGVGAAAVALEMGAAEGGLATSDTFWLPFDHNGEEVGFGSLDAITEASDLVVIGTVAGVRGAPSFSPDLDQDYEYDVSLPFAWVDIRIESILKGSVAGDERDVVHLLMYVADPSALDEVTELPIERAIFFLWNGAEMAARSGQSASFQEPWRDTYVRVNYQGVLREFDGKTVPIRSQKTDEGEWPSREVEGLPFDSVVADVRLAGR